MTQATLPTMNATGSTIPTGPRGDHRPEDIELCDRIARQMRRHNLAHRNEDCITRDIHDYRHYLETMDARTAITTDGRQTARKTKERKTI